MPDDLTHLTADQLVEIHDRLVSFDPNSTEGISDRGQLEYILSHVEKTDGTVHDKAYQLMRLLVANHPFVDGNKRTAMAAASVFYQVNGYETDFDRNIKTILRQLAIDEERVDDEKVIGYLKNVSSEGE